MYKLSKALYGLRQAPRAWHAKLSKYLKSPGFVKCPYEHAVYTRCEGGESLIIGVHVDDILVTGTRKSLIQQFKEEMSRNFDMSDLGRLSHYLGIEVIQTGEYIQRKQTSYTKKIIEKLGMAECKPTKYPMEPMLQLHKDESGKVVDSTKYKSAVGRLHYLVNTRPDIAYAVGVMSRYMDRPTIMHWNAVERILRYLKGTLSYGLVYSNGSSNNMLSGYSDSNFAGEIDDRKSTGGMVFYLNKSVITWVS